MSAATNTVIGNSRNRGEGPGEISDSAPKAMAVSVDIAVPRPRGSRPRGLPSAARWSQPPAFALAASAAARSSPG